ncbi:MAG: septum site-determining protein MinD [Clostridia bacterium]|nr:septum site-determining protein MinD [Clostridia bacterium]
MAEIIVVTSGKGGVGKTTVACFLGAKLAQKGKRCVVCDLDVGLNNLDIVMGVESKIVYNLSDALEGRCRASQILVQSPNVKNLYLISSGHTLSKNFNGENIKMLFEGLKTRFDYIIFDCPAGIDSGFHRAIYSADRALLVITPSLSSIRDADKVLSVLRSYALKSIELVLNMARGDLMITGEMLSVKQIEELLKAKIIGVIPQDDILLLAKNCYIDNDTLCGESFYKLACSIISGKPKYVNPEKRYTGVMGSIKRSIKKIV